MTPGSPLKASGINSQVCCLRSFSLHRSGMNKVKSCVRTARGETRTQRQSPSKTRAAGKNLNLGDQPNFWAVLIRLSLFPFHSFSSAWRLPAEGEWDRWEVTVYSLGVSSTTSSTACRPPPQPPPQPVSLLHSLPAVHPPSQLPPQPAASAGSPWGVGNLQR